MGVVAEEFLAVHGTERSPPGSIPAQMARTKQEEVPAGWWRSVLRVRCPPATGDGRGGRGLRAGAQGRGGWAFLRCFG
jgi:hypothetical protein